MISYTSTELLRLFTHPATRKLLLNQWPQVRCRRCKSHATAICTIHFVDSTGEAWIEFAALCAKCCLSEYGRGVASERATPPFYCPKRTKVSILATVSNSQWHTSTSIWA